MKKLIALLALLALPAALSAQGIIAFANASTPESRFTTNSTASPPAGQVANQTGFTDGVNKYLIGLYIAPQGTTLESSFTLVLTATNRSGAPRGLFNGGNPAALAFPANTILAFQVRAWQFNTGLASDTYENATGSGVYRGETPIGTVTLGDPAGAPGILFGTANVAGSVQVLGAVLVPNVPEPSSIALGLLGLGAIALFRRRK